MFRALRDKRTVVWHYQKGDIIFVFKDNAVYTLLPWDYVSKYVSLEDPNLVYIADSAPPPHCSASSLFITSPDRERYKEYAKIPECVKVFFSCLDAIRNP